MTDMEPGGARRIVFVVFDGIQSLDLVGPLEIFHTANRLTPAPSPYELVVASVDGRAVRSHSGLRIACDGSLRDEVGRRGGIDTLVVVGGFGVVDARRDAALVDDVCAAASRARRVTSVCTGAVLLAEAGLLDDRRATTHWASTDWFAEQYPAVDVDPEPIFVHDDRFWTSAGVTAGMDLSLALVADDLGAQLAHQIASWLVMFTRRPGGQSQFSASLRTPPAQRSDLADLQRWMVAHPGDDLTVRALAARVGMSPRHFARCFTAECGVTPARYVEGLRLERARHLLATTDLTVDAIARSIGLSGEAVLHRAFRRRLDSTPTTYRRHFAHT
jgi:transcriptional regulator GlxA family with amidase domain